MARGPVNVVLCGFMGAGKTTVARRLERDYGFAAVDTDDVVADLAGAPIAEVFARGGEAEFRRVERLAVARVAALEGAAIATGGGVPLDPANLRALGARGVLFLLDAPFETLLERLLSAAAGRPLAAGGDEGALRARFEARRAAYARVPQVVAAGERSPGAVAGEVHARFLALGGIAPPRSPC